MNDAEKREAAKPFIKTWTGRSEMLIKASIEKLY